jgi:NADH-quinone oxidoreductase subunit C
MCCLLHQVPDDVKPDGPGPAPPDGKPSTPAPPSQPAAAEPGKPAEKEPYTPDPPTRGQIAGTPTPPAEEAVKPAAPPAKPAPPKPTAAGGAGHGAPPKAPAVMAVNPWESDLTKALKDRFGDSITEFSTYVGQNFLIAKPDAVIAILEFLKLDMNFDYLVDITAVDWPKREARFDLVYVLYSFARNERIRVKTLIADGFRPASAVSVHLTADWLEREVFDMFGIEFAGHPNMKRILMPEEWQGYPLRKEYSILTQDTRWVQENLNIESGQ